MEFYDDAIDDYYGEMAGDFSVNDKTKRNKRSNTTCYSSKHIRQSVSTNKTIKGNKSTNATTKK